MKKISNNKKGFTLVELLAVIVVLAVIILIAMPSVLGSMEKARKNSFAVEANEIMRIAQTAYADKAMTETLNNKVCFKISTLVEDGYLKKDLKSNTYSGSVLIDIAPATGRATYSIIMINNNYSVNTVAANGDRPIGRDVTSEDVKNLSSIADSDTCGTASGTSGYTFF